jgi:hypothetical protein
MDTYLRRYLAPVAKQIDSPVSDPKVRLTTDSYREVERASPLYVPSPRAGTFIPKVHFHALPYFT